MSCKSECSELVAAFSIGIFFHQLLQCEQQRQLEQQQCEQLEWRGVRLLSWQTK